MGVGAWCCNADGWMGRTDHTLQTVTAVQEHLPCLRYKAKQFILCLQEKNKCAKEILRLKLRRRWPQRNIRAVWILFLESSLPRLSRSFVGFDYVNLFENVTLSDRSIFLCPTLIMCWLWARDCQGHTAGEERIDAQFWIEHLSCLITVSFSFDCLL